MSKVLGSMCTSGLQLTIRTLSQDEVAQYFQLHQAENWPLALRELHLMHRDQPDGFIGAFTDDGKLVGHVGLFVWSATVSYLSGYVTKRSYRGQGIGSTLFRLAMEQAGDRTVILHAVPGMNEIFQKSNFVHEFHLNVIESKIDDIGKLPQNVNVDECSSVKLVTPDALDAVCTYDKLICKADRSTFLKMWILSENAYSLFSVNTVEKIVNGYVVLRQHGSNFWHIYNFYADTDEIANRLFCEAMKQTGARSIYLVFPNHNTKASAMYKYLGLQIHLVCSRMFYPRDKPLPLCWEKVYALSSVENCYV